MFELTTFNNSQFGEVRTVTINGEPWFVGKDICAIFNDSNHNRSLSRVNENDKMPYEITDSLGRKQTVTVINEYGLYDLLWSMKPQRSNKDGVQDAYPTEIKERIEKLEKFKYWVTHEVLPSIRKTGGYIAGQEELTDTELLAKAVLVANKQIEERNKRIESLELKVALDAPKVLFADAVATSHTSILIGEFAKLLKQNGIDIGRDRLFAWLRENGWLIKDRRRSEFNSPSQKGMNLGLFDVKEGTVINPDGSVRITRTTKVTGKGQQYFINLFLNGGQTA